MLCKDDGGTLAEIETSAENTYLQARAKVLGGKRLLSNLCGYAYFNERQFRLILIFLTLEGLKKAGLNYTPWG